MSDNVNTHYVKSGFAESDDVVLNQTAQTRTIFRPAIHGGGVRGTVIRQKIGAEGKWLDINEVDFRKVSPDTGIEIELDTKATQILFDRLAALYKVQGQGVKYGDQEYILGKKSEVLEIDEANKLTAIKQMLEKGYSEDFWSDLVKTNPDLASRLAVAQIQIDRQSIIKEFEQSLESHADEEDYWQGYFEENPWILQYVFASPVFFISGDTYVGGKIAMGRAGTGGVATDFLFGDESTKSFAVVDIKKPKSGLVGAKYRGNADTGLDNETYSMHADLSGGVVQVRNQITTAIENFQTVLGPTYGYKLNRVHPKGVLITGTYSNLTKREQESFNQFRNGLYSLTVITYDELLSRLKIMFEIKESGTDFKTASDAPIDLDDIPF